MTTRPHLSNVRSASSASTVKTSGGALGAPRAALSVPRDAIAVQLLSASRAASQQCTCTAVASLSCTADAAATSAKQTGAYRVLLELKCRADF